MPEASEDTLLIGGLSTSPTSKRRLLWLVAFHCIAVTSPALAVFLPMDVATLPILWALFAIAFGSILTLAVWIGLGAGRMLRRLFAGFIASAYVAIWTTLFDYLQSNRRAPVVEWATNYVGSAALLGAVLLIFGGMFGLIGRRYQLTLNPTATMAFRRSRFQFSVLHVLVLMSIVAVVLSLTRFVRKTIETNDDETLRNEWHLNFSKSLRGQSFVFVPRSLH